MEPKQSSASPASAGKIVNLSGKHAGTLIKDTPAFPEGASPDVFRKNSRAHRLQTNVPIRAAGVALRAARVWSKLLR